MRLEYRTSEAAETSIGDSLMIAQKVDVGNWATD
jgi:hypothetical protein